MEEMSDVTGNPCVVQTFGATADAMVKYLEFVGDVCDKPFLIDSTAAAAKIAGVEYVQDAGLADRAEVELAYAIGVPEPVSIMVETFGTEKVSRAKIEAAVEKVFDCTPAGIIKTLNLKQPIYRKTASYGHFGREGFPWEQTDKVNELNAAVSALQSDHTPEAYGLLE